MKIVAIAMLILAGTFAAQAKIITNGPGLFGAARERVVALLSADLPVR